jgi:7-cyano-7-deazaguanine synthase
VIDRDQSINQSADHQIIRLTMPTAVLLSGGLDSAVLLASEAARAGRVQPIYVSVGLAWEAAERDIVARLLADPAIASRVEPLVSLTFDMRDVYSPAHWAVAGTPPAYHTPDEAVYLAGRNIVLLSKAAIFCAPAGIDRIVIGTLAHNPFPDATPAFRAAMAHALQLGLDRPIAVDAPFAGMGKADVVRLGVDLGVPLELSLSCMSPVGTRHCGLCSKCRERHDAFLEAGVDDPTIYVDERHVRA